MDDLRFYILFNRMSVISGRRTDNNGRLCAMEPHLRLEKIPPVEGLEPRTDRSIGQRLTY